MLSKNHCLQKSPGEECVCVGGGGGGGGGRGGRLSIPGPWTTFLKYNFCTLPVSTLAQHGLQNKGNTEMPGFAVSVPWKICHLAKCTCTHLSSAAVLMVFSAISMVSSFKADNDTDNSISTELKQTNKKQLYASLHHTEVQDDKQKQKQKNDCMHHCTVLRCRKSHTAKLINPN